jgi:hypothetical protein
MIKPEETMIERMINDFQKLLTHWRHEAAKEETKPDMPLKVRVAALFGIVGKRGDGVWQYNRELPNGNHEHIWRDIPDYPNDLEAAMGAFDEILKRDQKVGVIVCEYAGEKRIYGVGIGDNPSEAYADARVGYPFENRCKAICHKIIAHAEGK